jgi:predicted membrane-bound spermidine synthase
MYESKHDAPLPRRKFLLRIGQHTALVIGLLVASLGVGIAGYSYFENLSFIDAFLNASMLLGGMGPVNAPVSQAGKLFAGCYALYAGLVFIVAAALIFTPVVHRVLHKFHWNK